MSRRKPLSQKRRFSILNRDNFTCVYCGRSAASVVLEVDHIISIADGGNDEDDNLASACVDCNHGKSSVSTIPPKPLALLPFSKKDTIVRQPEDFYRIPIGLIDSSIFGDRHHQPLSKRGVWLWIIDRAAQTDDHCIHFTANQLAEYWGWTRAKSSIFLISLVNHGMIYLRKSHIGYIITVIDQSHFPTEA